MKSNEKLLDEVYSEPAMKLLLSKLKEEEKQSIETQVLDFINSFSVIIDSFQQIAENEEAKEELKNQLSKIAKI
jgi:hypothetical protein